MSKRKKKSNKHIFEVSVANIDYEKLADAIFQAQQRAKAEDKRLADVEYKQRKKQWCDIMHYKEYPESKNKIVSWFHEARNFIVLFWQIIWFKKKDAISDVATKILLQMTLSAILGIIKWLLYAGVILMLGASFCVADKKAIIPVDFVYFIYAILFFLLARIVRMAQYEAENITEREYLLGILSAVTSFVAMVLAVVALFRA